MTGDHSGRFAITPAAAADDRDLSDAAFRTLAILGTYSNREGWCNPSQRLIAERRGITPQAVGRHLKKAIALGWLESVERFGDDKRQLTNQYRLLFDPLPPNPEVGDPQPLWRLTPSTAMEVDHGTTVNREPKNPLCPTDARVGGSRRRATSIPSDWQPDEALREWALKHGPRLDLDREVEKFRDHHLARGKPMKDWQAAFRTWIRNAVDKGWGATKPESTRDDSWMDRSVSWNELPE